ncbi:MAG: hypothetical protein SGJ00_10585 [bacterium]|nr:hypothetical protein [bacterium]
MRFLILSLFLFFFGLNQSAVNAQELSYAKVDSLSHQYFNNLENAALIRIGKQALKEQIDFYYLRVRLGIAYFRLGNFEAAYMHFNKAVEMNPSEEYVLTYTYQCLLKTAQFQRANMFLILHPQIGSDHIALHKGLSNFELEGGAILTNNESSFNGVNLRKQGPYAAGDFFSGMDYIRAYFEVLLAPDTRLHVGGNLYQSNQLSKLQFFATDLEKNYSTLNVQLNLGLTKNFKDGWGSGFGMAYYHQNFTHPYINSNINPTPPNAPIMDTSEKTNSISISMYVSKRSKYIEPILFLNYGNFDFLPRIQTEAGITYFPLGNSKLFGYSSASLSILNGQNNFVYQQKIGFAPNANWIIEASYMAGSLNNYMGRLGFLTLNTFDPLKWSTGLDISLRKNRYTLAPGYRYQMRESGYTLENGINTFSYQTYNYYNHLFFITIKCQL